MQSRGCARTEAPEPEPDAQMGPCVPSRLHRRACSRRYLEDIEQPELQLQVDSLLKKQERAKWKARHAELVATREGLCAAERPNLAPRLHAPPLAPPRPR